MAKAKSAKAKKNGKAAAAEKAVVHTLARRDCKLPRSIHFRTQDHGDENVQASDIRVTEIELSEDEACALAQEKYFTRGLFVTGGRGKPDKPLLSKFAPLKLADTIESARVTLYLGPNAGGEFKLGVCKLKGVELTLDAGRKILMSCLVQSTPTLDRRIGDLVSRMNSGAQITIAYEHNAEQLEADVTADQPTKSDPENDKFEADAKAQIDAWNRGSDVAGDSVAGETH
jgi:hypothetical protein